MSVWLPMRNTEFYRFDDEWCVLAQESAFDQIAVQFCRVRGGHDAPESLPNEVVPEKELELA